MLAPVDPKSTISPDIRRLILTLATSVEGAHPCFLRSAAQLVEMDDPFGLASLISGEMYDAWFERMLSSKTATPQTVNARARKNSTKFRAMLDALGYRWKPKSLDPEFDYRAALDRVPA